MIDSSPQDGNVPTLTHDEVVLRYVVDFYDYPRSGVLTWNGQRYWFAETHETEGTFDVRTLTAEQWVSEDERNAAFVEHVGDHWTYQDDGLRRAGTVRPAAEHHRYYDDPRWATPTSYDGPDNPVVAHLILFAQASS